MAKSAAKSSPKKSKKGTLAPYLTAAASAGGVKKPSPYNTFMKAEIAKVKKQNPSLSHKEVFRVAAQNVRSAYSSNPLPSGPRRRRIRRTKSRRHFDRPRLSIHVTISTARPS